MIKIDSLLFELNKLAPLTLSEKMIEKGCYDNSGVIIKTHDEISKIMVALDLSVEVVKRAKRLGCDTIFTHHPAIYNPIKNLNIEDANTSALVFAIKYNMNVISFHLNLDIAKTGIDHSFAVGLGAKEYQVLDVVDGELGYGKKFQISPIKFADYIKNIKANFGNKILAYGNKNDMVKCVASFCGAGSNDALKASTDKEIDTIVTADMPHHIIKTIVENGKKLILLTHYASEIYGLEKFYNEIKNVFNGVDFYFYLDRRFR